MNTNIIEKLFKSEYYIYEHYLDGKLFYIGKGSGRRAIDFSHRSEIWKAKVNKRESAIEVKIIAYFHDELYARAFEKMHIRNLIESNIELVNIVYNDIFVSYGDFKQSFARRNIGSSFQYKSNSTKTINNIKQLEPIIVNFKAKFSNKAKGLIYSENIESMKVIEEMLKAQGFNSLLIWSMDNRDNTLTKEQIKAKNKLIDTGKIPEPYDFLVFNKSLFNILDLEDESIEMIIVNISSKEIHKYVRTLVKKDVDLLIYRNREKLVDLNVPELPSQYLETPLTSEMKDIMCQEMNIIGNKGLPVGWRTLKKLLIENKKYNVEETYSMIDNKKTRVTIITKVT